MESPIPDAARGVLRGRSYSFIYLSFSDRQVPTWFRWRKSGRRAESDSGGDGLLANPRIVARRRFQPFGRRHRNRSGGFCCFSPSKSREKRKNFLLYFWGQKYQKPPHVVLRGSVRGAALHGARKIKPMRHPVADAPQPAPSFSTSNESADLLCRQRRHYFIWQRTSISITSPFPIGGARLGSDGGEADGRLKATAAGTVCLQTRAVARRRFQPFGRRHRNRSGGFCCFSTPKSRERSFPELYAESLQGFRKIAVFTNFFLLVLLGPKVPKASARRFPRDCAIRGAARGAQDQAYAPPRGGRAAARTLFFRVKRECGTIVPPTAAKDMIKINAFRQRMLYFFTPQGDSRLGSDGERASGRLKVRAAGTVCLQTRTVARRRFQPFGRRHRNRSGGFCCFSPSKSR